MTGKDNEDQQYMTCVDGRFMTGEDSVRYLVAHDVSGQLIFERVKQGSSARYTVTISLLRIPDEEDQYFLTAIDESSSFIGCNCEKKWCRYVDCGEKIVYLKYSYELIGNTLDAAMLKYNTFIGMFGGLR